MDNLVILTKPEEEHLLGALESALKVRFLRHLFLWSQGQLQGLLPHEIMVCLHYAENDEVQRVECLRSSMPEPGVMQYLCDPSKGLAVRIAHYCRNQDLLPCAIEHEAQDATHPLAMLQVELQRNQLGNALVHGTERLRGGSTCFVLFGFPEPPAARQKFFLDLLLPSLHLAFLRVMTLGNQDSLAQTPAAILSERELEVLGWVAKGKSNYEISLIMELSTLTVKNHMQRIFRKLKVNNRVQAVLRSNALQLMDAQAVQ